MSESFDAYLTEIQRRCSETERKIDLIRENHLAHIQQEITEINVKITETKTDVDWLKKSYWILVAPVVGALAVGILNLIIK
jgi:uncharacterized coiled-coil protein SlyX